MEILGKRLGYRVVGGVGTILLGALAAAQAQRQGTGDSGPVPSLESAAWTDSLPKPIQTQTFISAPVPARDANDSVATVGEVTPLSDNWSTSGPAEVEGPAEVSNAKYDQYVGADPLDTVQPTLADAGMAPVKLVSQTEIGDELPVEAAVAPVPEASTMAGPAMAMPMLDMGSVEASSPNMELPSSESTMGMPSTNGPNAAVGPSMSLPPAAMRMPAAPIESAHSSEQVHPPGMDSDAFSPMNTMPSNSLRATAGPAAANMPVDPSISPDAMPNAELPVLAMDAASMGYVDSAPAQPPVNPIRGMTGQTAPAVLPALPNPYAAAPPRPGATQGPIYGQPTQGNAPPNDRQAGDAPTGSYAQPTTLPPRGGLASGVPVMAASARDARAYDRLPTHDYAPAGNMESMSTASMGRSTTAAPGDRRLEGVQTPSIVFQKRAPAEVKVGQPATFVVQVQNVGTAEAINVAVLDRIPAGMQLIDATPQPNMRGDELVWQLGAMPVGDERSITMQLVPMEEGELGSVARVTFEAAASVRTRSTRPELRITQQVRPDVLIGQQLEIDLEVSNIGTGDATNVKLQVDVPEGLEHPRGRELDNLLGSLRPGETRHEILRLRATAPGVVRNVVRLVADDAETVADSVDVQVTAPSLDITLSGPSRRFLERQATYNLNLDNRGTAAATNVQIIAMLDRGFTFVSTENQGSYDPNRHAVTWSLASLPSGEAASVPLTLLPVAEGDQTIRLEALGDLGAKAENEALVQVQSQAELTFSIADTADPIELGSETTYEIRIQNTGSRNDSNVQLRLAVPPGLEVVQTDGDAQTDGRGNYIFAPRAQMRAGEEMTYRVRVRGRQADTHVIGAVLTSDQSTVPVTKEESTMVYADR
ncbi:MAG: hypothetical protein AAF670_12060 [Planctomycetota bacterium]